MSQAFLESLFSLSGKVAVVIGGTGELCGAMAEGMAGAGAEGGLVGRNKEKADSRLAKIAAVGGKAWFLEADVSEKPSFEDVLRLETALGPYRLSDVMLTAEPGWISERSWEFWRGRLVRATGQVIPESPPRRFVDGPPV